MVDVSAAVVANCAAKSSNGVEIANKASEDFPANSRVLSMAASILHIRAVVHVVMQSHCLLSIVDSSAS